MPPRQSHVERARQNERFFLGFDLTTTPYPDWAAVAIFYAALHWIDAYLDQSVGQIGGQQESAAGGHHPSSHRERFAKIRDEPYLAAIYAQLRRLYDCSFAARYSLLAIDPIAVDDLYVNEYARLRDHLLARL
jgi:hypothetical protein